MVLFQPKTYLFVWVKNILTLCSMVILPIKQSYIKMLLVVAY